MHHTYYLFIIAIFSFGLFLFMPRGIEAIICQQTLYYLDFIQKLNKRANLKLRPYLAGKKLGLEIAKVIATHNIGLNFEKKVFVKYKFYTLLLENIFKYQRFKGVAPLSYLSEIQAAIIKDTKFEMKISKEVIGGLVQFLVLAILIEGFIIFTTQSLHVVIPASKLMMIISLQIIGALLFYLLFHYLKKRYFKGPIAYFKSLYLLALLSDVGISTREALGESKIQNVLSCGHLGFADFNQDIIAMIKSWKQNGAPPALEIKSMLQLLWFQMDDKFDSFIKVMQSMKLIVTTLFFLSSYFLFILELFTQIQV